ncbi:MAG: DNA alkylation repair protein [Clostridiales bacterium]|jgi:3-methyladenine DNA glycosylase AlkD|nr:DNA alkylation repair protein [Clostridiales bacterium]
MPGAEEKIRERLFELRDTKYRDFSIKLTPTVDPKTVIGVRIPLLRKLAKELAHTPEAEEFMKLLPHGYFEENNLHGLLIETIRDYDETILALETFLPCIDNWATCDVISPKAVKKHLPEFYEKIKEWLRSDRVYTVRFGVEMLLNLYLDGAFLPEMPALVAAVSSGEYYVRMVVAWYFAEALAKQPATAMPFFEERRLDKWTHNKAIQKAIESYRIGGDMKAYLRTLKVK